MSAIALLIFKVLISLAVSLAVLRMLSGPLENILVHLCPDAQAADFWVSYTRVMLIIAPLLLVLSADLLTRYASPSDSLHFALIAALSGLLIGLYAVGRRLSQFARPQKSTGSKS